jgi:hypothetical protein
VVFELEGGRPPSTVGMEYVLKESLDSKCLFVQEENLIAAVLLEQAALNLLHTDPPAVRKWAFHLVLAALRFSNCQQPRLANRAYRYSKLGFTRHLGLRTR